jgi:HSP20 family protein
MVWSVFNELERLRNEMNQLLGSDWRPRFLQRAPAGPPVNLYETPEEFVAVVEVPGADRAKFDISLTAGSLSIKGEFKAEKETGDWIREERPRGAFHRVVNLSDEVDPAKVDAVYRDGILTVRVAKAEAAKPRQIEVKVS